MVGQNGTETPTLLQMLGEGLGFELGQNIQGEDAGIDKITENEIDQPVLAAEGDGRFGPVLGQGKQAASFTAGHDHP